MSIKETAKNALTQQPQILTSFKGQKANTIKEQIEKYKGMISQALPKHLTADRIIQVSTTLISRTPDLAECTPASLIGAIIQCSILGFEPIPALGQCYLVPFYNGKTGQKEVNFIIGYKGMIDLARRSDKLQTIYAQCVYERDEFDYEFGLEPKLIHKPAKENRGALTHVYAVAKFTNGGYSFEVMSKFDVDKIKDSSQAAKSKFSPWNSGYYDEMAKKTVLRRLWKLLPSSIEFRDIHTDGKTLTPDNFKNGEADLNTIEADFNFEPISETEKVNTDTGEIEGINFEEK